MAEKVTDPTLQVNDAHLAKLLTKQGIDKDYVEFYQDYAPRSLGKSPYAKFYRDRKSNKRFMVVSGLPMVKPDGTKIEIGWEKQGDKYVAKPNLFSAVVEDTKIAVTCLSDQPDSRKEGDAVEWQPQLYLNNIEQTCGDVILLPIDPVAPNLQETTLEWDYGICKRRIRAVQGRLREKWVFTDNPNGEVGIKHNHQGNLKLQLGKYGVNDDEEIISTDVFNQAEYPLEIGASPETFYPDAHEETNSVDGRVQHWEADTAWATILAGAGTDAYDQLTDSEFLTTMCDGSSNEYQLNSRSIFLFYTEGLPNDAIVTGVVFSLYGTGKLSQGSIIPDMNVYSSNPASNTGLVNGDYAVARFGSEALSSTISYASWNTAGYNNFTLIDVNGDAFATYNVSDTYINKTGVTKLAARSANYDVGGSAPPWTANLRGELEGYYADQGSNKPRLVVTYTVPVTHEGSATLSGSGLLSAKGSFWRIASATLSGSGSLSAVGNFIRWGKATLSGSGNLSAIGQAILVGKATFSGAGTLVAIGRGIFTGKATLSGVGTLSAIGSFLRFGKATLSGSGALSAIGRMTYIGKATLSGIGSLSASGFLFVPVYLTLKVRALVLNLKARAISLMLEPREVSLTLRPRDTTLTLKERVFSFTLKEN